MPTILITGASRGIGLELATQLAARGDAVIGVCRSPSPGLEALGIRIIHGIDVTDPESVDRLRAELSDQPLDILINNAGLLRNETLGHLDFASIQAQFEVNALGPLRVTEALAGNLRDGGKLAIVTSRMGSIADNTSGGRYGYRASKAAANQIGASLSRDLAPRGIAVALLHPGLVATEMTGGNGIPPADAARGLIGRIDALDINTTGRFWHAEGYELPW
jgi:NAD(P)-dependent dehydrogenase (short-subunit alcohol dehydrogenase family)